MLDPHSQETTKYQATTTVPMTNRMATLVATDHISTATMGFALFYFIRSPRPRITLTLPDPC